MSSALRRWFLFEVSAIFLFVMLAIWVLPKFWAILIGGLVVVPAMIILTWWVRPPVKDGEDPPTTLEYLGIQPRDFSQTVPMLKVVAFSLALLFGLAYWLCPGFADRPDFWKKLYDQFKGYIIWAFVQQLILQGYFTNRLEALLEKKWLVGMVAGTLFAIAHFPNPVLMPATAIFGGLGAYFFLKSRNLYLTALFHSILGTAVKYLLANNLLDHGMRIGPGFWK